MADTPPNGSPPSGAVPHVREAGSGPAVVCLHSNASSSAQWRALMDRLAPTHRVLAPDSYGSGRSPDWPSDREITLTDERHFIDPLFDRVDAPLSLVGHSYGGAVALIAALAHPGRIRSLVLYEPTLFSLVDALGGPANDADGIRQAVHAAGAALDAGDPDAAAGHFIDYWMGAGAWRATPETRRPAIVASVRNVRRWSHALFGEPTPASAFAALDCPVLLLLGSASPASAHAVARALRPALRDVRVVEFPALGHMGPITHPAVVNAEIVRFLAAV